MDFFMYVRDPGGFFLFLVIRHCVIATEATMEKARSVEEDGHAVNVSVGCEAEGMSTAVTS